MKTYKIADAIEDLRNQVVEAQERAIKAKGPLFKMTDLEVEMKVVAQKDASDGDRLNFSIPFLSGGVEASASTTQAQTHSLKFKLQVLNDHGDQEDVLMNG